MGQEEVLKVLEKEGKPLSRREISLILNERVEKISSDLRQLIKFKEIKFKVIYSGEALKIYQSKRKMRLYYIE